jgi:hypothetical protein
MTAKRTTKKAVRAYVRSLGLTVTWKGNEFRVNYPGAHDGTAYYSDNAEDAIQTAQLMAQHKGKRL